MTSLDFLAQYHEEWINICKVFVGDESEDVVQDMYIKMYKNGKTVDDLRYGNSINKYYVYRVLKSICIDYLRKKKDFVNVDNLLSLSSDDDSEREKALNRLFEKVDSLNLGGNYHKTLFEYYLYTGLSMRELSSGSEKEIRKITPNRWLKPDSVKEGTGISLSNIFHTIKECKKIIKEELKEDYEDFKNEDYERI